MSGNGGKRPGAGRPLGSKNKYKKIDGDFISKEVLRSIDSVALWKKILGSNSIKVVATGLMYLMDRVYGRPAQTIQGGTQPLKIEFSWNGTPEWMRSTTLSSREPSQTFNQIPQETEKALAEVLADSIND